MSTAMQTFDNFKLNKQLVSATVEAGYETPTLIQQKAIPLILAGHDVLGIAQTGTGKTAAFTLPLLMKIKYAQGVHPRALVLAPTRELVMQITENIKTLSINTDIRTLAIYGGLGPKTQIEAIEAGVDVLVSTPGRLLDIYTKGALVLKEIKTLVMDEADKMMDMGFMHQIRSILEVIPVKRQNLLFSATMPEKVVRLSEEFLEFPEVVEVTPQSSTVDAITQVRYEVPNMRTKLALLEYLFNENADFKRVIIFAKTKSTADNIYKFLDRKVEKSVRVIHANKGQNTRINAMEAFKTGEIRILVTTDVASRGIDISMVSHVINFDVPIIYEDYVHRIGRTGRANQLGAALTFQTPADIYHIEAIEKMIKQSIPQKPMPAGITIASTPFDEQQLMDRDLDTQRKRMDPDFKGAFHEKKKRPHETRVRSRHQRPGKEGYSGKGKAKKKGRKR